MKQLIGAVIVGGLFYMAGQYLATQPERERQATEADRSVTVTAEAEVSARPDVAEISVGTRTERQTTAERAVSSLAAQFNRVLEEVRALGIEEGDVSTTNFSLQPEYSFEQGRQDLLGYVASEQIKIKVRELEKIGEIISRTTTAGANQVGGVQFRLDEDSEIRQQAEEQAITKARDKAARIAEALGVSLGPVKSYTANGEGGGPVMPFAAADRAEGGVPELPVGSTETKIQVTITFELR
jgi:uncharacterized protein YggE